MLHRKHWPGSAQTGSVTQEVQTGSVIQEVARQEVLHRKCPDTSGFISTAGDKGELWGVPATLDDLILVFSHYNTGKGPHQISCNRTHLYHILIHYNLSFPIQHLAEMSSNRTHLNHIGIQYKFKSFYSTSTLGCGLMWSPAMDEIQILFGTCLNLSFYCNTPLQ